MLRIALTILQICSLSLPPGFCVCRLGESNSPDPRAAVAKPAGCSCRNPQCAHRKAAAADAAKSRRAPIEPFAPMQPPAPEHAVGCPANAGFVYRAESSVDLPASGVGVVAWAVPEFASTATFEASVAPISTCRRNRLATPSLLGLGCALRC